MTRNKKLASVVSVLALLVLGGVGVVLGNTSAAAAYTWRKGSGDFTMGAAYDYNTQGITDVAVDGTKLDTTCWSTRSSSLIITQNCLSDYAVGAHTLTIYLWSEDSSGTPIDGSYDASLTITGLSYTWRKGNSDFTMTSAFDYNTQGITDVAINGTKLSTTCWSTQTSSLIIKQECLVNYAVGSTLTLTVYYWSEDSSGTPIDYDYDADLKITGLSYDWRKGSGDFKMAAAYDYNTQGITDVAVDGTKMDRTCWSTQASNLIITQDCLSSYSAEMHLLTVYYWSEDSSGTPVDDTYLADLNIIADGGSITYTLSFGANGGSGAPANVSCTTTAASCTVTIPSTTPTRSNYTFKGWADSSSASSASYQAGGTVTLSANKTVYAVWEASSTNYIFDGITRPSAITGVANGTAKTAVALGLPSKVTVSLINASDLSDYSTAEWDVNWNVAGSSYNPSNTSAQTFTVTGTVTLPSNVTNSQGLSTSTTISVSVNAAASKTYTLSFNVNGGSGTVANQSCTTTSTSCTVTIPSTRPTRSGYTFKGWGSSSSATSATYQPGNTVTLTANRTLYAVWAADGSDDGDGDDSGSDDSSDESGSDADESSSNASGGNGVAVPDTGANGRDGGNGAEAVWMVAGAAVAAMAGVAMLRRKHVTVNFSKK